MSGDLALITSGLSLREDHIVFAIESRAGTKALLQHLAEVSMPDTGASKVLLVYARMATTACDWIDGELRVDLVGEGAATAIHTFTELGGGLRERLFAPMRFDTPLAEFARSIGRVPHMIAPLALQSATPQRLQLSATELVRRTTVPPPLIGIATDSLFVPGTSPIPGSHAHAGEGLDPTASEDGVFNLLPLPIVTFGPPPKAESPSAPPIPAAAASPPAATLPPAVAIPVTPKPNASSDAPLQDVDSGWDE